MSTTLTNLIEQIRADYNLWNDENFSNSRLIPMINRAQRDVQTKLGVLGLEKFESVSSALPPIAGTFIGNNIKIIKINSTNLPNFLEKPDSIRFLDCNDGTNYGYTDKPITPGKFRDHLLNSYLSATAKEPECMRLDNSIYVAPSTITSVLVHYYSLVIDLSAYNDPTAIPDEFIIYIVKLVGIEIESIQGKLQNKQLAIQELDKNIQDSYKSFMDKQAEKFKQVQQNEVKMQ